MVASLAGVAAGAALVACGGSSSTAPTKAAYVAKANNVCKTTTQAQSQIPQPTSRKPKTIGGYVTAVAALSQQELTQLPALAPPDGQAAAVGTIYTSSQQQVDLATRLGQQLTAGDAAGASATFKTLTSLTAGINGAFDRYGMTSCGSGSSGGTATTPATTAPAG